ncbi:MAG: endonuclease, partial [Paludibacteraceae bacterium]|nr:endonuclease [Paludibacteraceae bacterium]
MKKHFLFVSVLLAMFVVGVYASDITPSVTLTEYYASINGKSATNDALRETLCGVISANYNSIGYSSLASAVYNASSNPSDFVNGSNNTLEDIYSSKAYLSSDNKSSAKDCGEGWNKEHTVPQSWFGGSSPMYSDAFHIYPTDIKMNSVRSNYPYGENSASKDCSTYGYGHLGTSTFAGYTGQVFDPGEGGENGSYKGDIARGYFYMVTRYRTTNFTSGSGNVCFTYTNGIADLTTYTLNLMLKWHREDPVSEKELKRNNAIYAHQRNRNPFIDYPDLVEYIWGERKGENVVLTSLVSAYSDEYGGGATIEPYNLTLYRNGEVEILNGLEEIYTLPTTDENACEEWVFDGWSATKVSAVSQKPAYITKVSTAGTVYAVYKNIEISGGGVSNVTMTFADQFSEQTDLDGSTLTLSNSTISFAKGGKSGSAPTYYTSGSAVRFYANNTITISSTATITGITLTTTQADYSNSSVNTGSFSEGVWSGESNSVVITNTATSGHWRITAITVTTTGGTVTTTYASDAECDVVPIDPTVSFENAAVSVAYGEIVNNGLSTNSNGVVTFSSNNESVAMVDETGEVVTKGVGTATITANIAATRRYNAASASYVLTVTKATPIITINNTIKTKLKVGDEDLFEAESNLGSIEFSSSDPTVATIDELGIISAVKSGTTHIRAFVSATQNYYSAEQGYDLTVEDIVKYNIIWSVDGVETKVEYEGGAVLELPSIEIDDCEDGKKFVGWTAEPNYSGEDAPADLFTTVSISNTVTSDLTYYAVYAVASGGTGASDVVDVLDRALTEATGSSYSAWSGKKATSDAVYAGQSAGGNDAIQLRSSNSNSGIITTTSGGKVKKIVVEWQSSTSDGRTINIYGKNSAYSSAADLYSSTTQGDLLGTIVNGTSTELVVDGDYEYIGIRSASGALYLSSVEITWSAAGGSSTTYSDYSVLCGEAIPCTIESISVNTNEAKTEYEVGDEFTTNGVVVTASYSGTNCHSSVVVGWTATEPDMASPGEKTITISYEGKTVDYNIVVAEPIVLPKYNVIWSVDGVETKVEYEEGAVLELPSIEIDDCEDGKKFVGWTAEPNYSGEDAPADLFTTVSNTVTSDLTYYAVYAVASGGTGTSDVVDVLDRALTEVTNTTYTEWSGKSVTSSAVYAGQSAGGNESIQLRSNNNNSGIITTTSGGKVKKIVVEWQSSTSDGRTINIYGKNSAYSSVADLYNSTTQGDLLGTIVNGTSTELVVDGDYEYIGIRSASGALYLSSVEITWSAAGGSSTTYSDYTTKCGKIENTYTITWNVEGVETTSVVEYGAMPAYEGVPEKAMDAQYTYEFSGWSPALVAVTGDATYTALFTSTLRSYTITWNVEGVETTSVVEYGAMPAYKGVPEKAMDAQYTYEFSGWSPALVAVTGDATYTAQFDGTLRKYLITFYNEDGVTVVESKEWEYGEMPTCAEPTKPAQEGHEFAFAGWAPTVVKVSGEASYIATYNDITLGFTILFKNDDGSELDKQTVSYGEIPVYAGTKPTKEADAQYTYEFAGWTPQIVAVTGYAEYVATYTSTLREYTVTWVVNGVESTAQVAYGTTPTAPEVENYQTVDKVYTFLGWDKA